MGEKNPCYHQNVGEISSGELRRSGSCDPIGVDIFATGYKRQGTCVRGIREASSGIIFASSLLWKSKYLLPLVGTLSTMPVNKYVIGLQDPVTSSNYK